MLRLFSIALRGMGTADVEALDSYLYRLAIVHGVSTETLIQQLLAWYRAMFPTRLQSTACILTAKDLSLFVRPNFATQRLLQALMDATGVDTLRCGTFVALGGAVARSVQTYSSSTRWCPGCMAEFVGAGDPGYFKLLWHLNDITHCPIHRLRLIDRCTNCEAYQRSKGRRHDCTSCSECGASLARGISEHDLMDSWKYEGADLIELVEVIANNPPLTFPHKGAWGAVRTTLEKIKSAEAEGNFLGTVYRSELALIANGRQAITLATARRLAYRFGMRISDLLAGTVAETTKILDPTWTAVLPSDMRPRKRHRPHNRKKIFEKMQTVLATYDAAHPPALRTVAKQVGVSVGCLEYHFPAVAHQIIERHRAWREKESQRKKLRARVAVLGFFTHERYALERKSRKNALRVLRAETGLPKNLLREEIAMALSSIEQNVDDKNRSVIRSTRAPHTRLSERSSCAPGDRRRRGA